MKFERTKYCQFELEVLGPMPKLGEIFTISHNDGRERHEVQCLDFAGNFALVERTDDGPALRDARSAVLAENGAPQKIREHEYARKFLRDFDPKTITEDESALRCWCGGWVDDWALCTDDPAHIVHPAVQAHLRRREDDIERASSASASDDDERDYE